MFCVGDPASRERVEAMPDLTGRLARCDCGVAAPSSTVLSFFEFRGVGSPMAHRMGAPVEFDRFFCGHTTRDLRRR